MYVTGATLFNTHPDLSLCRYVGYGGFFLAVYLIYHAKPLEALDIKYWAKPRASDELAMEMRMLDKLQASSELQVPMPLCSQSCRAY